MKFLSLGIVDYDVTIKKMEETVQGIIKDEKPEQIWFLEHPPLYTAGTSAKQEDLINPLFPVFKTGRGGEYTYHGNGQLIGYIMIKLHHKDIKHYLSNLSDWIILTLKDFGVDAFFDPNHVGIWVKHEETQKKIAAFGIRITKWVTWHGFSLNINPNLAHYKGIVPCGIKEYGITSLHDIGSHLDIEEIKNNKVK